jgi:predicted histidine transporter YuiF (NhaC family)
MTRLDSAEASSYAGAIVSIVASLTLTDIGVIIGIATALATFWLNRSYTSRKDKREQREYEQREREHEARMRLLERGIHVE